MKYIQNLLESEKCDLTILDQEVLESLQQRSPLAFGWNHAAKMTDGQQVVQKSGNMKN